MTEIKLPVFKCHKEVQAARIKEIVYDSDIEGETSSGVTLIFENEDLPGHRVHGSWMKKHLPQVGGWFVRYADGYESYSPDDAFLAGYSLKENPKSDAVPAKGITKVRAKFRCYGIGDTTYNNKYMQMGAIYGTEGENADFAKATPSGILQMNIDNGVPAAEFFKQNKDYYLDFIEA